MTQDMMIVVWLVWYWSVAFLGYASPSTITEPVSFKPEIEDNAHQPAVIRMAPDRKLAKHRKRNIVFTRALAAVYHYYCQHGGYDSRTFIWQASFDLHTSHLKLQSLQNIDRWGTILDHDNEFSAFFYHRSCIRYTHHVCSYDFLGYTEGEITPDGIALYFVQYSDIKTVRPTVVEVCVPEDDSIPPGFHQCPAQQEAKVDVCRITSIDVHPYE